MKKHAFSIIELVIVISILGLLVTAVVGGSSIIGQAKLRAIKSEVENITESTYIFDSAYGYLPGDIPTFSSIMNHDANCAKASVSTATANGDGDRHITYAAPASGKIYVEGSAFWCHLKLTGTNFGTGGAIATTVAAMTVGTELAPSKISSAAGYAVNYETGLGNHLVLVGNGSTIGGTLNSVLTTKQAYKVKSKFDNTVVANAGQIRIETGAGKACITGTSIDTTVKGKACIAKFFLIN